MIPFLLMSAFSYGVMPSYKKTRSKEFGRKEIELGPETLVSWRSTHSSHNTKKLRDVLQEREVASFNKFWTILSVCWTIFFIYLGQSWSVSIYLDLFWFSSVFLIYFNLSLSTSGYLELSWAFLYKNLIFWAISSYFRLS